MAWDWFLPKFQWFSTYINSPLISYIKGVSTGVGFLLLFVLIAKLQAIARIIAFFPVFLSSLTGLLVLNRSVSTNCTVPFIFLHNQSQLLIYLCLNFYLIHLSHIKIRHKPTYKYIQNWTDEMIFLQRCIKILLMANEYG